MESSTYQPRKPWLAALLSLLGGPLGQIYDGRLRRSLCLWLIGGCLFPVLLFCFVALPIGRLGFMLFLLCAVAYPVLLAVDAFLIARRERDATPKRYQRWWAYAIFFVMFYAANIGVAQFARSYIAEAFIVPTRSMAPTILPGERILVDRLWASRNNLHRGDLVVFRSEGPDSPLFVQRIVGLPGDEMEIRNERVFINGESWDDHHARFDGPLPPYGAPIDFGPTRIAADNYFMLGDNRRRSKDSRTIGPIPASDLYGVARLIYWPRERMFPDPNDTSHYKLGPFHWDRMGRRLD